MGTVYQINKGINKSIEFKGLKAQYIWYLGGCLVALLVLFSILYISGINGLASIGIVVSLGILVVTKIHALSKRYGEHGLMKKMARRQIPHKILCRSRRLFSFQSKAQWQWNVFWKI